MSTTVTALYGGSFNPIHNAHLALGRALVDSGTVDELWFLVSPQNPLKRDAKLLDETLRLHLARLAVNGEPWLSVSDYEFSLPRPSYTVHTLECLRASYPDREFALVMGADNWQGFGRWYRPQEIMAHHRILVYPRPGYGKGQLPDNVSYVDTPLIDISSTEIRQLIARGGYDGRHLPAAVWQEIKRQHLYGYER